MTINWQDVIVTVFTTVGGGAVLLGAGAYLIKTALTHRLTQETETFKAQLKANSDAEIERLKNSLQMTALEHQVRFFKLHEKRAEVIADLYTQLVEVSVEGEQFFFADIGGRAEEMSTALEKIRATYVFIEKNRIYLPEGVCSSLDKYLDDVKQAIFDTGVFETPLDASAEAENRNEKFMQAYRVLSEELPAARQELVREFRAMLGESQDAPTSD